MFLLVVKGIVRETLIDVRAFCIFASVDGSDAGPAYKCNARAVSTYLSWRIGGLRRRVEDF